RATVEVSQRGCRIQPTGDVHPSALTTGQAQRRPGGELTEVEHLDELVGAPAALGPVEAVEGALGDELVAPPVVLRGAVLLADVADRAAHGAGLGGDVVAADGRGAARRG